MSLTGAIFLIVNDRKKEIKKNKNKNQNDCRSFSFFFLLFVEVSAVIQGVEKREFYTAEKGGKTNDRSYNQRCMFHTFVNYLIPSLAGGPCALRFFFFKVLFMTKL